MFNSAKIQLARPNHQWKTWLKKLGNWLVEEATTKIETNEVTNRFQAT